MTLIRTPTDIPASEITPEVIYHQRRTLMKLALAAGASAFIPDVFGAQLSTSELSGAALQYNKATAAFTASDTLTPLKDVTSWNNFYELGFEKSDPAENASKLQTANWKVAIDGAVEKSGTYTLEDILKPHTLEERIYRLRCVEAWSMVIPWIGIPLADVLNRFNPTSSAKYVVFESIDDPAHLPGQKPTLGGLDWPYVEGLRMDEAMHPLTILAVGLYGKVLPNQNGAPLRLIVPWKYGFKSIKSIVRIHLQDTAPKTTWNKMAPQEYGFYANVNPEVDHPRWSQKIERRLPGSVFNPNRITTQMFNGYGEQVASLYRGMDLKRDF